VAVSPDGTAYVVDYWNHRVQAFGTTHSTTWRGEYFNNRWLTEMPVLIRQDAAIDFSWGSGSPGSGVPADNFSARWRRYVSFDANTYRFTVSADDGVRLWVDDKLLIEAWQDPQVTTYSADISLAQGYHRVRLEYYEAGGSAAVRLSWERVIIPGPPADITVTADPASIPVGGSTSTIQANVTDAGGNPVADGTVVTFTTSLGSVSPYTSTTTYWIQYWHSYHHGAGGFGDGHRQRYLHGHTDSY
jgi:hypothetical protein